MKSDAQMVMFCGLCIPTIKDSAGRIWVAAKQVVEGIGVDWKSQHEKLTYRSDEFEPVEMKIMHNNHPYDTTCIPLDNLNAFLYSINYRRIKDVEVRNRVMKYQKECQNALRDYWLFGIAVNSRSNPTKENSEILDFGKASRQRLKHFITLYAEHDEDTIIFIEDKIDALLKVSLQVPRLDDLEGLDVIRLATTQEIISRAVAACWRSQLNISDGMALIAKWTREGVHNLGNQLMVMQVVFQKDDGTCF